MLRMHPTTTTPQRILWGVCLRSTRRLGGCSRCILPPPVILKACTAPSCHPDSSVPDGRTPLYAVSSRPLRGHSGGLSVFRREGLSTPVLFPCILTIYYTWIDVNILRLQFCEVCVNQFDMEWGGFGLNFSSVASCICRELATHGSQICPVRISRS